MKFIINVAETCRAPLGYGHIYYKHETRERLCAPIPLNLVIRILLNIHCILARPGKTSVEVKAYNAGFKDGKAYMKMIIKKENDKWQR